MTSSLRSSLFLTAVSLASLSSVACSSSPAFEARGAQQQKMARRPDGSYDDHSLCEYKNMPDREASETAGPGSIQPNVRRVYLVIGSGDDRHKVLICREIDTNFDGIKDVVRRYNEKGESVSEEADSNYDGRIDTWITFIKGRLAEVKLDTNFDGRPDEWKYYSGGKLTRVVRDTNFDGRPDVWEIYRDGHLERRGVDIDGDEHVDRWDHDNEMRRRFEEAERKKEEEAVLAAQKKAAADKEATEKAVEADEGKDPPKPAEGTSKRKPPAKKKPADKPAP